MNIVSFGGGVNSTAMIIGMHQKKMPIDLIVFADTGGERPNTYAFIETFSNWLSENGLPRIAIVQKNYHGLPYTLERFCLDNKKFPGVAYGIGQCAVQFKMEPVELFCNNNEQCKAAWKRGEKVGRYVGYDAGEQRRINKNIDKYAVDKKYHHNFPLVEWGWARDECVAAIKSAGLPLPGKSSCFFCPNNKKDVIQNIWEENRDLFDRAIAIERNAGKTRRDGSPSSIIGLGREWSWEEYRKAYLEREAAKANQFVFPGFEDVLGGCCCGMPCGCYDG
jgi:hypothetical protein